MSKVKVLFFSADPLSAHEGRTPRLLLDEDVRQIQQKVRAAEHRDALEFDLRLAARTDDLLQALNETRPQVVHFSGHGKNEGLVLVSADGRQPHVAPAAALKQLFEVFRGDIRVVVLNACFSLPQAQAIADVVGCAIGTRGPISDEGAITFGGSFYRAIAFGHSVQVAFKQARAALALDHHEDHECPELVVGRGVDPAQLVLVSPGDADAGGRGKEVGDGTEAGSHEKAPTAPPEPASSRVTRVRMASAALVLAAGAGAALAPYVIRDPESAGQTQRDTIVRAPSPDTAHGDSVPIVIVPNTDSILRSPDPAPTPPGTHAAAGDLDAARAFYQSENYAAAFPLMLRAAEAGAPEAMGYVGMMYLRGQGTERTPERAVFWLHRAAEKRDARGMNALGVAYQRGEGVERSYNWARHWYLAAAEEKGYAEAMRNLGSLYRLGLGVEQSNTQALEWYEKAARAGSLDGMVDVGLMYEKGLGVQPNVEKAMYWYRTAAEAGLGRAMFSLGLTYQEGVGTPRDYGQARAWYLKGADAGSADAMNNLGVLFQRGWGVRRDQAQAISWFRRAAAAGSTDAQGNLAALGAG